MPDSRLSSAILNYLSPKLTGNCEWKISKPLKRENIYLLCVYLPYMYLNLPFLHPQKELSEKYNKYIEIFGRSRRQMDIEMNVCLPLPEITQIPRFTSTWKQSSPVRSTCLNPSRLSPARTSSHGKIRRACGLGKKINK